MTVFTSPRSSQRALRVGVGTLIAGLVLTGCSTMPDPPSSVGENYPGTCMPGELSWPTDFLESLPGESAAVGGAIVGLRLEYIDSQWVWRLRSAGTRYDGFGERVADAASGRESLVTARTLETIATRDTELTQAEQETGGTGALAAAQRSGEQWPSPLIVEMARVMENGRALWRVTTCDTETGLQSAMTVG